MLFFSTMYNTHDTHICGDKTYRESSVRKISEEEKLKIQKKGDNSIKFLGSI